MTKTTKLTNGLTGEIFNTPSSRRKFLTRSAAATGGLASILATGSAPALGRTHELKALVNSHFVPASDEELKRQLAEFGKAEGVKTRLDRVAHIQLPAVLAGEVQGQKGHEHPVPALASLATAPGAELRAGTRLATQELRSPYSPSSLWRSRRSPRVNRVLTVSAGTFIRAAISRGGRSW